MADYLAYELSDGSCNEKVEVICKHLTNSGSFDANAQVQQIDVDQCITMTYYEMGVWLSEFGYSTTQTAEAVVGFLEYYNALGASARVELSLATTGFAAKENSRHRFLWVQYKDGLREALASGALANLGATELTGDAANSAGLTAGGISISDKEDIETNTDATKYSFSRKLMDHPQHNSQNIVDIRNKPE